MLKTRKLLGMGIGDDDDDDDDGKIEHGSRDDANVNRVRQGRAPLGN